MIARGRAYRIADRQATWSGRLTVVAVLLLGLSLAPFAPSWALRVALAATLLSLAGYVVAVVVVLRAGVPPVRDESYFD